MVEHRATLQGKDGVGECQHQIEVVFDDQGSGITAGARPSNSRLKRTNFGCKKLWGAGERDAMPGNMLNGAQGLW
jgi:hypothetical protein